MLFLIFIIWGEINSFLNLRLFREELGWGRVISFEKEGLKGRRRGVYV